MSDRFPTRRGVAGALTAGLALGGLSRPAAGQGRGRAGQAFAPLREAYLDRTKAARTWVSGGGAIGYTCETTPVELIAAAGFLPYRVSGDPRAASQQTRLIEPFLTKGAMWSDIRPRAPESEMSMFSLVLDGRYAFLDRLVISNSRKSVLRLQGYVLEARDAFPQLPAPKTYVLDRTQTPFTESRAFNRDRVMAFREVLGEWAGRPVTDEALAAAIAEANAVRAVLRRTQALRSADAPKLSGVEALWIYGASRTLPAGDFLRLANNALAAAERRPGRPGKRLFVAGSSLDHSQLYEVLEGGGATVVGDDHSWGDRLAERDVSTQRRPMAALVDHYETLAPVLYPISASVDRTLKAARAARPQGAIFNVVRGDEITLWEIPDQRTALEGAKIPCLHLKDQPYRIDDPKAVRAQVAAFVGGLPEQRS